MFIGIAAELGLDVEQFTNELDDGVYTALVAAQEQEAIGLGLPGTPAVIFDGELLTQLPPSFFYWNAFVDLTALATRQYEQPPEMMIDSEKTYLATVMMASGDEIVIEMLDESAPQTVNSFIFLAEEGWFDHITFHRVLPEFIAQTGDPTSTGFGGPGYTIPNEVNPELSHAEAGMVAMANSGADTNGSQWYITLGDASFLDGSYTIFGRVIEGMDVAMGLTVRDPQENPELPPGDAIETVTISEVDG